MSNNYFSNNFSTQFPSTLSSQMHQIFREHNQKFQWKDLMKIDVNYIKMSKDIRTLEPFLENILSSTIEEGEIQMIPEEYIIRLINLLQLTGEYLIYVQQRLEEENQNLNAQLSQSMLKSQSMMNDNKLIQNLKREKKEKDLLLMTYQKMIQNYSQKGIDVDASVDGSQPEGNRKERFYCQFCSGKKFYSEQYLEDHMRRRHLSKMQNLSKSKVNMSKNELIESKLGEMKNYFENLIKTSQMRNEYDRLNDKLTNLENTLLGSQQNPIPNPNLNFSQGLPNSGPSLNRTIVVNPNDPNQAEIQNALMKINTTIERDSEVTRNKFQELTRDLNQLKRSVATDISGIKQGIDHQPRPSVRSASRKASQQQLQGKKRDQTRYNTAKYDMIPKQNYNLRQGKDINWSQEHPDDNRRSHSQDNQQDFAQNRNSQNDFVEQKVVDGQVGSSVAQQNPNEFQNLTASISEIQLPPARTEIVKMPQPIVQKVKKNVETPEELELQSFYSKFMDRDNSLSGRLSDYLIKLT